MTRYCLKTSKTSSTLSTFKIDLAKFQSELNETGDEGNSDKDGDLIDEMDGTRQAATLDVRLHLGGNKIGIYSPIATL